MRDELEVKNHAIANLETQISGVVAGNNDQVSTIAELETKLSGVMAELLERDVAIANLKTELAAGNKQLTLFPGQETTPIPTQISSPEPEPEPEPEPITQPESNPEEIDFTGTIPRGELVKFINEKFKLTPPMEGHRIGDCFVLKLNGKPKSQKLATYESDYGFKYVGMLKGEHRFRLNCKP